MILKDTLTNYDIIQICKHLKIKLNGIFMKDELHGPLKAGNYIMNLQNHNQSGSHWTCFIKKKNTIYYFDSYGIVPPQNQIDLIHREGYNILYNKEQIQDLDSDLCGWWCIAFLLFNKLNPNSSSMNKFKFVDMFDLDNPDKNDKLLTKYFKKFLK